MIKQKTGNCSGKNGQYTNCGKENVPLISSRQHCNYCSAIWKKEQKKSKPRDVLIKKKKNKLRKPTGELAMFLEIWNEREHKCEHCGKNQPIFYVHCFAHIKPKGTYPELRLVKSNIRILCHYWDDGRGWHGCHQVETFEGKTAMEKRKDMFRKS